MKLGLINVASNYTDCYQDRIALLEKLAEQCCFNGADLVFFPEYFQYGTDDTVIDRTDELQQKCALWKAKCAQLAKKHHTYFVPWDYEYSKDGVYNTCYILDRDGTEIGRHRKVHLPYSEMKQGILNGTDFAVYDLDFGRIGIMICFDNYFPESSCVLANRGAELILYPLYGDTLHEQWELKLRARACDNHVYLASCQIDSNNSAAYTGVISPTGQVLEKLHAQPSCTVIDLDVKAPVYTNTMAKENQQENIKEYLKKCKQQSAYLGILQPPENMQAWNEIFTHQEEM